MRNLYSLIRGSFLFATALYLCLNSSANAQDEGGIPVAFYCKKECINSCVPFGSPVTNRISVYNPDLSGTVNFSNVIVTDDQPVPGTVIATIPFLNAGQTVILTNSYTPNDPCTNQFSDTITITALSTFGPITNTCRTDCPACPPCLQVTGVCSSNLVVLCNNNASAISFSGTASNCGSITLSNIVLTDDLTAGKVLVLDSLAPGESATWSTNLVITAALCNRSNIVNTVTATGTSGCNPNQTVTNRSTCSFSVVCASPSLSITKACASPIATNVGSSITVTGQVCNTGLIEFTNVMVVDAQPGLPITATNNLGSLAAGECKPYSFTYTATSCDVNHDTVQAIGSSPCGNASAQASADCFLCCPNVTIQELVACLQPGAICSGAISDYHTNATGILGNTGNAAQDKPAFCYVIIVRNTGHDPLTNIVIFDDQLGALGTFPGPLAVGGTITISNLRTNWATTTTNTATVTARCGGSHANGASVTASASAVADVAPAAFECQKLVSVNGGPLIQTSAPPCGVIATNITWYVVVTNTSAATLRGITVQELGAGPGLLPCGPVSLALTNVLLPGETTGPVPICSSGFSTCVETNINNSILVRALAGGNACAINLQGSNIVAESTCSSSLTLCCNHLTISKACASPIVTNVGSTLTVTGEVCNLGGVALTNVVIVDSQPGLPITFTNIIDSLPAGACQPYTFSYTATSCDPNHDVVTVSASDQSGNPVGPITASADCFLCCPNVTIQELVTCLLPGAVCSGSSSDYHTNATGIKGNTGDALQDNPAFCYMIVVRNTGHDPLTNIVIYDDQLGALGSFPGPLAVGGTITISNLRTNWADTTTNTATVSARCGGVHANGAAVTAQASAVATVVPAAFECQKLVSVNGGPLMQTLAPHCNVIATNITWYVVVTNSGEAILRGITVQELGAGPDLLPCGPVSLSLTNVLLPGETTGPIPICTSGFNLCVETNIDNSILVRALLVGVSNECAINLLGSNIVAESQCNASLTLCCKPPVLGCRVTGGGRQDDPEVCPADVRYVSHGGQVGGPLGNASCVVTLDQLIGNPCIKGRWTHVRHNKGGLEGNFHARFFDTFSSACLATNIDLTGLYSDGTCNPVDPMPGLQPSRTPANKVVFTGVGDWMAPNGSRVPRSVLFRVDVEDRAEPGGFHPRNGQAPFDRYRIRIWVLSDAELASLTNPADGLIAFRNAIAACNGLKYRDGVLSSAMANNCGGQGTLSFPGGAPVRLPDIDDGGALKNGDEQLHPTITDCP